MTFVLLFHGFYTFQPGREAAGNVCQVITSSWVSEMPYLVLCWSYSLRRAST